MRNLCFIFSLYALMLSLTPCADEYCNEDEQFVITAHTDEETEDLCSSFCICVCCGYAAVELNFSASKLPAAVLLSVKPNSFYRTPYLSDFSIDFWQPPKIG